MSSRSLDSHYLLFGIAPATPDILTIRQAISDALGLSFGATSSATYLDILWIEDEGTKCVIRIHRQ